MLGTVGKAYRKYEPVGSGVWEMAMQLKNVGPEAVNCVRSQRSAIWS